MTQPIPPGDDTPAPLLAGTFVIYATPDGGYVLVTDVEGRGIERKVIPAALVRLAQGGGPFGRHLSAMFGGGPS